VDDFMRCNGVVGLRRKISNSIEENSGKGNGPFRKDRWSKRGGRRRHPTQLLAAGERIGKDRAELVFYKRKIV
jgi:hypothetical protein